MKLGPATALDRRSELRTKHTWLAARTVDGLSKFMILVDLKAVIQSNEARTETTLKWFSRHEIQELGLVTEDCLFLGMDENECAHFVISLSEQRAGDVTEGASLLKPQVDLRSLADQGIISGAELSLIGEARSLSAWHISHRYCGHCGEVTISLDGGWRRKCQACELEHYPRMDPVVIMLITFGNKCLLARDVRFPKTLYSALAGYLEPGEDIESAVRREVMEEVGLELGTVDYKFSQPWPFPHSLMIGCRAEAKSDALTLDAQEIADAYWVDKANLANLLDGSEAGSVDLPQEFAIANKLMRDFLDDD